jgi:outer membrane receptor protein involved in Fe transport
MKKMLWLAVTVAILLPSLAMAVPSAWLTIQKAYVEQLDIDTYRLRVHVDFGGDIYFPDGPTGPVLDPRLVQLSFGSLFGESQYNPTWNAYGYDSENRPGDWQVGGSLYRIGSMANLEFGYDFEHAGPILGPLTTEYQARVVWAHSTPEVTVRHNETLSGSITADIVPEPGTILLLGFGLAGGVPFALRRRKRC